MRKLSFQWSGPCRGPSEWFPRPFVRTNSVPLRRPGGRHPLHSIRSSSPHKSCAFAGAPRGRTNEARSPRTVFPASGRLVRSTKPKPPPAPQESAPSPTHPLVVEQGGGEIGPQPIPVPQTKAVTAGAGAATGRKAASRRFLSTRPRDMALFLWSQGPFLFLPEKKKWTLPRPGRPPHGRVLGLFWVGPKTPPHPSGLRPATFPPRGKAFPGGRRPPLRPHPHLR